MTAAGAWRTGLLTFAAVSLVLLSAPVWPQAPDQYEVRPGDTLFAVVRKTQHTGITRNQMMAALYRANQERFPGGNIHSLPVGVVLDIPSPEAAAAIAPAEADRVVRDLLARLPAPPLGTAKPSLPPASQPPQTSVARPAPAKPRPPALDDPAKMYREGLARESRGDDKGALQAFLAAGEAGHGPAQRKLGEIYDKGNSAAARDYETALKWYQKAREQGVELRKPLPRMPH